MWGSVVISYSRPAPEVHSLTGAGLEVALSEDGGDGGRVVQAVVVVIWAQGWWI